MKKYIYLFIAIASLYVCKAQTPIVAIDASRSSNIDGTYFKDLNNEFDKFEGIWKSTTGGNTFTIQLQKKEQIQIRSNYYDILEGEYKYEENGITIINTLPLNIDLNNNIGGGTIIKNNSYVLCDDCVENERRLKLYFNDPERSYLKNQYYFTLCNR